MMVGPQSPQEPQAGPAAQGGAEEPQREPDPDTIELLVDQAEHQIKLQDDQWNSLRTKAAIVLASAGVVFGKTAELHLSGNIRWAFWLSVTTLSLLLAASLAALYALLPNKIRLDPAPRPLIENYWLSTVLEVRLQLLPNLADTYEYNQRVLRRISRPMRVSLVCLSLALIAFFVVAIGHWRIEWQANTPAKTVAPPRADSSPSPIPPSSTTAKGSSSTATQRRSDSLSAPR